METVLNVKDKTEEKILLDRWAILQHCNEFQEANKLAEEIYQKFNIKNEEEIVKRLEELEIIE